ncbi:MAG: ATP-binding cassette domain-containing protein [Bacteroidota bacterium]
MSEEILNALTQLFAIFSKQDGGVNEEEREYVIGFFNQELDQDSIKEYLELFDKLVDYGGEKQEKKRTSMKDSVRVLGLCRKINKTLTQAQKIVVLTKIIELVKVDGTATPTELEILGTVADVFNFEKEEYEIIRQFIFFSDEDNEEDFNSRNIIQVRKDISQQQPDTTYLEANIDGQMIFLKINSVEMYFIKYIGGEELNLNGFIIKRGNSYLFSQGSSIKPPASDALYYSDIVSHFNPDFKASELSFLARDVDFKFPSGDIGLRGINIRESAGKLVGIMGASGSGKTTLLNVLAGLESPSKGSIEINGIDINTNKDSIQGVIGYVSQDDLLIEELTVYENLYYNAKLCFDNLSEEELTKRVDDVLTSLGLAQRKDLKVGSVLDKIISGGQRKRLNIALELIREPGVLFVDEPTSGLSSRDSENVIDLLKELSIKGKLIFVVIHQPSSDIYKMFDKMFIMDTGGYPIYYGNPVEAVIYFKEVTHQVDKIKGQCTLCGNVNPEQVFNIIESHVVDEYGQLTDKRKLTPVQWNGHYLDNFVPEEIKTVTTPPVNLLKVPSRLMQSVIFMMRDVKSKLGNKQYLLINFLEAPLLALILAFIIKYTNLPGGEGYSFYYNENIPVYILMALIVALFMGLSVSAEEIIKDRKILKRESFLNLHRNSYLSSKVVLLLFLSAVQTLTFAVIGNVLLEIQGMTISIWLMLFTISSFANLVGLNLSSAFNSAITVYILIPIVLIPQMILAGLMFDYDRLNDWISSKEKVPILADVMASRWAFEAIAVDMFKSNAYEAPYYKLEKEASKANYVTTYVVPQLTEELNNMDEQLKGESNDNSFESSTLLVRNIIQSQPFKGLLEEIDIDSLLAVDNITAESVVLLKQYVTELERQNFDTYNLMSQRKDKLIAHLESGKDYNLNEYKMKYHNQSLEDLVRKVNATNRSEVHRNKLIQHIDPIYNDNFNTNGPLNYRAHFYAPVKPFMNKDFDTYWFNFFVIWSMTIFLYIALYFEWLLKLINAFGNFRLRKIKK